MQRIKIITLDKTLKKWPTLPRKLSDIISELNTIRNGDFSIDVEYRDLIPDVKDGRITHEWMDSISHPAYRTGYDFVAVHLGDKQRRKFGIQASLRGSTHNDYDLVHESYFWADEDTLRMRRNQFIQTFLHEIRHGLCHGMSIPDDTHAVHADGQIRGTFAHMDMFQYKPERRNLTRQVSLLKQVVFYLAKLLSWEANTTLYRSAHSFLGRDASPADIAPDLLGCAESVSNVIQRVLPDFPIITGTWTLWQKLEEDPRFRRVTIPMPGTIIIAPTGSVRADIPGHVGIFGPSTQIMSNNSLTGTWEENYTLASWQERYETAGYTSYFYQLIK